MRILSELTAIIAIALLIISAGCADDDANVPDAGGDAAADTDADGDTDTESDTALGDDEFPMEPEDFAEACTPTIVFENLTAEGNGQIFDDLVEDPVALMHEITAGVCALLYREPSEVPTKTQISLTIDDIDGVAGTGNAGAISSIQFSSTYLADFADGGGDVLEEIYGVLFHEVTHVYQLSQDYGTNWAAIEGVADTVRYYAGYVDPDDQAPGGSWTTGYKTTAFFFVWLEERYIWFIWSFNQSFTTPGWSWDAIEDVTGHPVDELWVEYQADIS
jgi:hypothetical protein